MAGERTLLVTPDREFTVPWDFSSYDKDPVSFREHSKEHDKQEEGAKIDSFKLNIANQANGSLSLVEIGLKTDEYLTPLTFPGDAGRIFTFRLVINDLTEAQIKQAAIALLFRNRQFNADVSNSDDIQLRNKGKTSLDPYSWIESGRKEDTDLGFLRSELPDVRFKIGGFPTPWYWNRFSVPVIQKLTNRG